MSVSTRRELQSFSDWIRAVDHHASHHLTLTERADRILSGEISVSVDQRRALADKLERWRYQHLNERAPAFSAEDTLLLDALDLAANALADRDSRPARRTRDATRGAGPASERLVEAAQLLDGQLGNHDLIQRANELTHRHFGLGAAHEGISSATRRMLMYAPLYVSNECVNHCTYCGFSHPLDIARQWLSVDEVLAEARLLRDRGFRHILIVAGDFPSHTTAEYFRGVIEQLVQMGMQPAIEIAPQSTRCYATLAAAGIAGLTLYQETYDESLYGEYHVRGPKSSYHWRLEGHDRAAETGVERLGLGILLGLAEPVEDLLALIRHGEYLAQRFPQCTLAFSLPRIHEAPTDFTIPFTVSDDQLIHFYCVLRVAFPEAELVLSTRESVDLRSRLARMCITQLSSGSSTSPGGYQRADQPSGQQFPVSDQRSPAEVARWLQSQRLQPVWSIR